ncbi:MAG TPA: proline--tRNA ligase [Candidatus Nitrosopelagicus sp.]|jgi:prolyl-tRNA synthetase|nr:proline--tRNA ligase [Candidatus Nitrosopelagicus sp.]
MGKEIGITVKKSDDFSEWYTQLVIKAELADYAPVKGLIVLRPDGYSIWESIKSSLDSKLIETGHRNGFLPVLIPESLLGKEKDHFTGFNPEVFWVTHSGDGEIGDKLALRPTSETLAYTMYAKWIRSWRDLPLKINFWNSALRAEIKATKPFLRTSEFLWQEGHTAHAEKDEAQKEVTDILEIYKKTVEDELAIPVITGKKSENEKFVGAVYTLTMESLMPDGKALQMGTTHFLGQNFSKPFEVKYADKNNVENFVWQTSWGVSWRLIGGMIMVHGDDKGLVLPPRVAPIQVVIIPIYHSDEEKKTILEKSRGIKEFLESYPIRVHLDDRDEVTPGFKFNYWEMKGVPIRIELGPKDYEEGKFVLVRRDNGQKQELELAMYNGNDVMNQLDNIHTDMFTNAKKILDDRTINVETYDEFKSELEKGMLIKAAICDNQSCEEKIKEETGADIRVIPDGCEDESSKCVYCTNQSKIRPFFARGY